MEVKKWFNVKISLPINKALKKKWFCELLHYIFVVYFLTHRKDLICSSLENESHWWKEIHLFIFWLATQWTLDLKFIVVVGNPSMLRNLPWSFFPVACLHCIAVALDLLLRLDQCVVSEIIHTSPTEGVFLKTPPPLWKKYSN